MFRWTLTAWRNRWWKNILYAQGWTNVPLHAYLYYSTVRPIKATVNEPHRGGWCIIGDYWWPMPLTSWEQVQPGDTILHSWITPQLAPNTYYYLMVFPSPDPNFIASTSLIWSVLTSKEPFLKQIVSEDWNTGQKPWRPKPTFNTQVLYEPWSQ